ncbi:alpha/beta fold hydrolase [Celerinatantimonas sp. YJH-8]|uniref:alpha/beta fold hydrolase n=1 Tax=Celerinatantimonas sp. YJH-8 TaxID=3228714 RepID=UPI0038C2F2B1
MLSCIKELSFLLCRQLGLGSHQIVFNHQQGQACSIEGAQIYYECLGEPDAPALILLHGGFGQMEIFNPILAPMLDRFHVIGIDSRGHGASTLGEQPLSYGQLQQDVEALLEHLGIRRCHLLGFSDGGIVGYRMAVASSIHIDSLVTIGSRWHIQHTLPTREQFLATTAEDRQRDYPQVYQKYQQLNPQPDFPDLVRQLVAMWLDESTQGYPGGKIQDISCPLLVCRGDQDPLLGRQPVYEIAERLEQAQLFNLPGAKHMAFADQAAIFRSVLGQFWDHL